MSRTYLSEVESSIDRATLRRWLRTLRFFRVRSPSPYAQDSAHGIDLVAIVRVAEGEDAARVEAIIAELMKLEEVRARRGGHVAPCHVQAVPHDASVWLHIGGRDRKFVVDEASAELAAELEHALTDAGFSFEDISHRGPFVSATTCPELGDVAPPKPGFAPMVRDTAPSSSAAATNTPIARRIRTPKGWSVLRRASHDVDLDERLYAEVFDLVSRGETEAVERMRRAGVDLELRSPKGESLLHAVRDPETARYLLERGLDPDARDGRGRTPLHEAREPSVVAALLDAGAEARALDDEARTTLMVAGRSAEANQLLLEAGVDVNRADEPRLWTALFHQCLCGGDPLGPRDLRGIEALLDAGADPSARDRTGRTVAERAPEWIGDKGEASEIQTMLAVLRRYERGRP